MKNKGILYSFVVVLMFMSIVTVDAATTYKTFNEKEVIKVNLNDTIQKEFYVIEDKGSTVKAILTSELVSLTYKDETTCTFASSNLKERFDTRTSSWENATSISLPTTMDVASLSDTKEMYETFISPITGYVDNQGKMDLTKMTNVAFYALQQGKGTQYFTSSVLDLGTSSSPKCYIYVYGNNDEGSPRLWVSNDITASIRPVIEISKSHVEGGLITDETEDEGDNKQNDEVPNPGTEDEGDNKQNDEVPNPGTEDEEDNKQNDEVPNPGTSDTVLMIVVGIIAVAGAVTISYRKLRKN